MRRRRHSTLFSLIVGLVLGLAIVPSWAQEFYGNKTVRFIVAYAAGEGKLKDILLPKQK